MKKIILTGFLLISTLSFASTQSDYQNELKAIDKKVEAAADSSTAGETNAEILRYKEMDKLLNKYYNLLMKSLKTTEQKNWLKSSQREWVKFRDTQFKFNDKFLSDAQGTMWYIKEQNMKNLILKHRVDELVEYLALQRRK